ncbi:alpha/beta hydrolase [Catenuloplanes atrovinosus]|uniref:Pimeloyl-ACP methyl ester carboxylesterase n=1 Tax=Catenuloplanes atrovinosus TaxID=137266 RepID=A0AAE3YSM8_9ACTN|nr:alpha/beta fold hydrolase [Catenuloplanes atrovinosus]MDR7277629.1 pimeloyl-ACP methyl ester carboxylesterase [Catenuloplanes atrovinosus]
MNVTLNGDMLAPHYRMASWLCTPDRPTRTVQVLLAGLTYDHRYWTTSARPAGRSYAQEAVAAGYAVLYVDRLGTGRSDRPPAGEVDVVSEAYVAHQVVAAVRDGRLGWYETVIAVGHSYGSMIWTVEAAAYDDVDALALTGYMHGADPLAQEAARARLHPAAADPAFAGSPDGYLTTMPGTRGALFHYLPGSSRRLVALDERMKSTGTIGELASLAAIADPGYTRRLRRPVLLLLGDHDALFCNPRAGLRCGSAADLCAREGTLFGRARLSAVLVKDTGHSITMHQSAPRAARAISDWARTIRGPGRTPDARSCT